jgi:hypothetical protein
MDIEHSFGKKTCDTSLKIRDVAPMICHVGAAISRFSFEELSSKALFWQDRSLSGWDLPTRRSQQQGWV